MSQADLIEKARNSNLTEVLEAYSDSLHAKYGSLGGKLSYVLGGTFCNDSKFNDATLKLEWAGLHETRCELITIRQKGADIWYSSAKSLEETHDDLNDPKSLTRLDLLIEQLIISALTTENQVLSNREQTNGTETRPTRPSTNRGNVTPAKK
jgi:hypothetical protein